MVAPKKACPRKRVYFKSHLSRCHYCLKGGKIFKYLPKTETWSFIDGVTNGLRTISFDERLTRKDWEVMRLPEGRPPCP